MRLLLFDIDGTLLRCGPQVGPLFAAALVDVFGTTGDLAGYEFAGKTDPRIVLDLMTGAGIDEGRVRHELPRVRDAYAGRLERGLRREGMRLLPGVAELLAALVGRADLCLGLLTGNWEAGARTKLSRFGLNRYFPFGAFGDDGVERWELVPAALERAERATGRAFRPEETVIIGDTAHDVACGRHHGAPVLAVATGTTPAAALEAAGADWVVADLPAAVRTLALFAPA